MTDYSAIDHLVIAGPDLAVLSSMWREATGISPSPGGPHPGGGTRNQLVGIDDSTYIELIAPDEDQPVPTRPRSFGIDDLTEPRFAGFALAVDDLDAACEAVRSAGIDPGVVRSMQRMRPDGVLLSWRLAAPPDPGLAGVMPFLIEWGASTPHPASGLSHDMSIVSVSITHPHADTIAAAVMAATGWQMPITVGAASLGATVRSETAELTF